MPIPADVRSDLTDILVAVVDCDPADVVDDARLADLGVDSLALVELADELGRRHDRYLDDDTVNALVTVADAVRAVVDHGAGRPRPVATTLHSPAPPPDDVTTGSRAGAMSKIAGVFIVIGAVIGGALGLGGAAFVAATGIGGVELPPISAPSPEPSPTPSATDDEPSPSPDEEEEEEEPSEPTFRVESEQVAPGQRFGLSGRFPELGGGEVLQVQVREGDGDWEDFPVTATTLDDGRYQTQVYTSRTGERDFRMLHRASDTTTDERTVAIG